MNWDMEASVNVFGEQLIACSTNPLTGFFRSGCCDTGPEDHGRHTVCAIMTDDFLAFSKEKGNDLSTPWPQYGFPGLKHGDRWCLCMMRWVEAFKEGRAPQIFLEATHESVLKHIKMDDLLKFAYRSEKV